MGDYQGYEDWKQWDKTSFGTWSKTDAAYYSAELRRSGIKACKGIRLYEIGFGNGAFAGYVHALGCKYYGAELNHILVERAREFGLNVSKSMKEALEAGQRGEFDAVVAFDVLEHFEINDIKAFLLEAMALLKPGGVVLARVPSGDSPFGRAIFHGDITHRTALGSLAVWQLAAQTGFDVIDIGPPKLPIFGLGWKRAIRRSAIRLTQSIVTQFINLVFHDGQPRVITSNLLFVLRKPTNQ